MPLVNRQTRLEGQSKTDRVYAELRRRIRELILPPGAPLHKEELALAFGVSRAPISEAIARLAEEALVDVLPQHGSFVAPIRAHEVRESLFVRTALEVEVIRRVAQISNSALMAKLDDNLAAQEAALRADELSSFHDLDESLHATIFTAIAAPRALRLLDAARAPLDRPRRIALPEAGRAEATLAEHRRLVDAIRTQDPEFATAAMRTHLAMVAKSVERQLAQIEATARGTAAPLDSAPLSE